VDGLELRFLVPSSSGATAWSDVGPPQQRALLAVRLLRGVAGDEGT
jgi:hypothetical protein